MAEELEKTCENCEYENEDIEGSHCRHCIHNAAEHFAPKINHEKEIRAKAIDEFARRLKYENRQTMSTSVKYSFEEFVDKIAEQLKGGAEWQI